MKAVIYHADGYRVNRYRSGIYQHLIEELRKNVNEYGMSLIHLTLAGHQGQGDENFYYAVNNPDEIIWNREYCIWQFLANDADEDEHYLIFEPDFRIIDQVPPLTTDLCLLYREDPCPITPAWRMCTKRAAPFFEEVIGYFDQAQRDWHGDSVGYSHMWNVLGQPKIGDVLEHNGISIEFRPYGWYASRTSKARYTKQWKGGEKLQIATPEFLAATDPGNQTT